MKQLVDVKAEAAANRAMRRCAGRHDTVWRRLRLWLRRIFKVKLKAVPPPKQTTPVWRELYYNPRNWKR